MSEYKINDLYSIQTNKILGTGSFSTVYLGAYKNNKNNMNIAIKLIKNNELIQDECVTLNLIKSNPHPNIVSCLDIITKLTNTYIILEYCDSGDLRDILTKPIKEEYAKMYFLQLTSGLKYLYNLKICHRDLKPRNILLTNKKKILKIADFGFAYLNKENEELQNKNKIINCGSPLYMAPEMLTNNNNYNKTQTDLWSVGIILYEMLFNAHPFSKCTNIDELKEAFKFINLIIPPINTKNTQISSECINLLKLLLQKDYTKRITWDDYFDHEWLDGYDDENKNKDINITKVGTPDLHIKNKLLLPPLKLNNLEIIDDYYNVSKVFEFDLDLDLKN
jgi:serine/threonine protein kinase